MNYVVLDLEWNQCPGGKEKSEKKLPFEIIEIGAVRLDEQHKITGQFREVVRPQVYTTLHYKTREIVALRSIDFEGSRCFPEVAADFFAWCGEAPEFCTWGPSDLTELQRNLAWHKISSPFVFPVRYYDIQKIFSIVYEDRKSRKSLEFAVDFLNIPKEVPFHSALSDAFYTSCIMQRLTNDQIRENSSVDYFLTPQTRAQELYLNYETYSKFVSKPFASKTLAMKDRVVTATRCTVCGHPAARIIPWFSAGSHNQICLARCREHGYIKGKIRLRQTDDGQTYAVKTLKPVSEEEAAAVYNRKNAIQIKRRAHHHK